MSAPFLTQPHNHAACVDQMLTAADRYCAAHGLRLTDTRRRVLELIWADHKPIGAYALLERLGDGARKAAPPTVYRALEFLLEHGLIHRIESRNAYLGCTHPGERHAPQFFICQRCGEAAELDDPRIGKAIAADADHLNFDVASQTVEISGVCAHCRGHDTP